MGKGYWGDREEPSILALISEKRTYRDRAGLREETVAKFILAYRDEGLEWNFRPFDSLRERQGYLDSRMDAYSLYGPVKNPDPVLARAYHPAQDLVESNARVVSLLGGRLVLEFDLGRLEVYHWPRCVDGGVVRDAGHPGYRESVCRLLNRCVTDVDECLDTGLEIRFLGGAALHIGLDGGPGSQRPVVARFQAWHGGTYTWKPGEAPFGAPRLLEMQTDH